MALVVQKYGGTSLASPDHIKRAAKRVSAAKVQGNDILVVVSAMADTTDSLFALAHATVKNPPRRELDMLLTAGERISMALFAMALEERGISAISFTGSQGGIVTTSDHSEAKIKDIRATRVREELEKGRVVIVAGFQGVSEQKEVTTLGRGGSDTTAVALAAALGADRCEILTDVDGIFTADPRLVSEAKLISDCDYDEALELSSLGAKMHSRSIALAKRYGVRVQVASSSNDGCRGTWIVDKKEFFEGDMERTLVRGIATQKGFHYFEVKMAVQKLVTGLCDFNVPLRFFSFSGDEVQFICETEKADQLRQWIESEKGECHDVGDVSIVSAVGEGLSSSTRILPLFYKALERLEVPCYWMGSNSLSLTSVVPTNSQQKLTQELHEQLKQEGMLQA